MPAIAFHVPGVEVHTIRSKYVDQTYQVQVMQPVQRAGERERFPTLYVSDANLSFDFAKSISLSLQVSGQVRPFMLIGIGYPGDNPFVGQILRYRDFTSHYRAQTSVAPHAPTFAGVPEIESGKKRWGGAADFLAFVRHELIPFIDDRYPSAPNDRAYAGHSLGGGLGLHTLFSQSDLFSRYILTSPSIAYDNDDYGIREAQEFIASGRPLNAQVLLGVGELEELDPVAGVAKPRFVSSCCRLAALLNQARIPGLELTCRVYSGETHASVWPVAFSRAVRSLYRAAGQSTV